MATGTGWTVQQCWALDLRYVDSLFREWQEAPPTSVALSMLMRAMAGDGTTARRPAAQPGSEPPPGWRPPRGNTLPDLAMAGQIPGLGVSRVPAGYYEDIVAQRRQQTDEWLRSMGLSTSDN